MSEILQFTASQSSLPSKGRDRRAGKKTYNNEKVSKDSRMEILRFE